MKLLVHFIVASLAPTLPTTSGLEVGSLFGFTENNFINASLRDDIMASLGLSQAAGSDVASTDTTDAGSDVASTDAATVAASKGGGGASSSLCICRPVCGSSRENCRRVCTGNCDGSGGGSKGSKGHYGSKSGYGGSKGSKGGPPPHSGPDCCRFETICPDGGSKGSKGRDCEQVCVEFCRAEDVPGDRRDLLSNEKIH